MNILSELRNTEPCCVEQGVAHGVPEFRCRRGDLLSDVATAEFADFAHILHHESYWLKCRNKSEVVLIHGGPLIFLVSLVLPSEAPQRGSAQPREGLTRRAPHDDIDRRCRSRTNEVRNDV